MLYGDCQSNNGRSEGEGEQSADERLRGAEAALQAEREWAQVTLNSIGDAVLTTDVQGRVTYLNRVAEELTGWASRDALGKPVEHILKLVNNQTFHTATNPARRAMTENRTVGLAMNCLLIRQDGSQLEIEDSAAPIHNHQGFTVGAVVVFHDACQSLTRSAQFAYQAQYDALTSLPNRFLFAERLSRAIGLAKRHRHQVALLYLDIDNFKCINDSLGHALGDRLLQAVAERLSECIRVTDTVCRQGGDEFVILLSEIEHTQDAVRIAEKILTTLAKPCLMGHVERCISASIGVSLYPDHASNEHELLNNADAAMYHAKRSGRNQYQVFQGSISPLVGMICTPRSN
ncbi:diguanylate cyclase domain-containing protein [Vreelandella lutescens]|uniref:Diguanylate cyclase n=1 Tax=Vreelandella lutescens TaxID=1602943 RepID=A0ABQ1P057_9GAMM|nr:diguanylate cyclase [Halomonas lutescens]GGC88410.1 hypothetical protein GCM10011382_18240 [Halomonas lutescens]